MRPLGEYLAARGLTVVAPLLPGHGTTPEDLARCRWQDWTGAVEEALTELRSSCEKVFVGGLSMGALLTLYLAERHPLDGIIVMAPALLVSDRRIYLTPILKHFVKFAPPSGKGETDLSDPQALERIWCYDLVPVAAAAELLHLQRIVRRDLARVTAPCLIFQGRRDKDVPLQAAQLLYDSISSVDKELVWLDNSGHCLTVDSERELVGEKTYRWIMDVSQFRGKDTENQRLWKKDQ